MMRPKTLFRKVWDQHVVCPETEATPAVLYIDLHLLHEVTSPQAFQTLRRRGLKVRRPDRTLATVDHATPSLPPDPAGNWPFVDAMAAAQVRQLETNCADFGIPLHKLGSQHQGIVHVIGPELGLTQPGKTVVCGDSHTSTHGAFGTLAFGIGTSEVAHVLATQSLLQTKPRTMAVNFEGSCRAGVTAKDLILALIAQIGVGGATGCVIEYRGPAVRALSMEGRMTLCNMSIEAGARAGMIAADDKTFAYLHGREAAPKEAAWDQAMTRWRHLHSDDDAVFDREVTLDANQVAPMITYGTNPGMAMPVDAAIPDTQPGIQEQALAYMGFKAGEVLLGTKVDTVFIGSCTNARISDLRTAARLLSGRKVAGHVRTLVVPGSRAVYQQAESEGVAEVFRQAGAEWREPSCSMCIAMNGDQLQPGELAVSTSNRNFEGRQGPGGRTLLASPLTAAAAAVTGVITDPRQLQGVSNEAV